MATLIQAARDACQVGQLRRRLLDHWWGTSQEQAYQSLHAAEILLVDLASPDELEVTEPQRYIATLVCSTDKSMASGGGFSGGAEFSGGVVEFARAKFSGGQVAGGGHGLQYPRTPDME